MELNKAKAEILVECLYEHIVSEAQHFKVAVTEEIIDEYLDLEIEKKEIIKDIYREYIFSLQNRQSLPNVLKFNELDHSFLMNFNCQRIVETYRNSTTKLLKSAKKYNPEINIKLWSWKVFAGGILDGAKFFLQFKNFKAFKNFLKPFVRLKAEGALILAQSIGAGHLRGMGLTLAMDFLKNSGTTISPYCVKPDIHLLKTLSLLGFVKKNNLSGKESQILFVQLHIYLI